MKIVQENFPSIHQMLKVLNERENNEVMKGDNSSQTGSSGFTMTESWDYAVRLIRFGYTDILGDIKAGMKQHASFQETVQRRKMQTAVQGFAPHVPNALLGVPNAMFHYETNAQKTKAVSLLYSGTASAFEDAETFVKSGIAVLSLVHALEIRGYRVQLKSMFFSGQDRDEYAIVTVNLKGYREHLDLHKLCFPIAHPSMLRRFGFKWLETVPNLTASGWSGCYGSPLSNDAFQNLDGVIRENEYLITLETIQECAYNVDTLLEQLNLKK